MSPKLFNTELSQIHTKSSVRKSLQLNRCLIYADGFFVWKQIARRALTPYYIYPSDKQPFCIAGYWEEKDEFVENSADSFIMLTVPSNQLLSDYQEDMPLILPKSKISNWMDPGLDVQQIRDWTELPLEINMSIHPVSPAINSPDINDSRLIQVSKPADQHGNYTLFG